MGLNIRRIMNIRDANLKAMFNEIVHSTDRVHSLRTKTISKIQVFGWFNFRSWLEMQSKALGEHLKRQNAHAQYFCLFLGHFWFFISKWHEKKTRCDPNDVIWMEFLLCGVLFFHHPNNNGGSLSWENNGSCWAVKPTDTQQNPEPTPPGFSYLTWGYSVQNQAGIYIHTTTVLSQIFPRYLLIFILSKTILFLNTCICIWLCGGCAHECSACGE